MAYLGYAKLGISQHEIAAYLKVTGSAVSQMAVSGEKIARESGMGKLII
jgi:predicted transcriptional regulator